MTKAADNLATWKAVDAKQSEKWRDEFTSLLDGKGKTSATDFKKKVKLAETELTKEMEIAKSSMDDYEKVLSAFHDDVKGRLTNAMTMLKALADPKTATPQLHMQAKGYVSDIVRDLDRPLEGILKESKKAQGNRLDLFKEADVTKALKTDQNVPKTELLSLLKDYMAARKKVIDQSAQITVDHLNKIKSYVPRAMDLLTQIDKFAVADNSSRDEVKADLAKDIDEAIAFFKTAGDGNFLMALGRLNDVANLAKSIESKAPAEQSRLLVEAGGRDRVASYVGMISKAVNAWKIQQKRIELIEVYGKKVKNDTLLKKIKALSATTKKNKVVADQFKAQAELIAASWKSTASLRNE